MRGRCGPCRCPQALQGNTILLLLFAHIHVHSDSDYVRTIRFAAFSCDVLLRIQPEQPPQLRRLRQEPPCRKCSSSGGRLTALIPSRVTTIFLPGDPPATKARREVNAEVQQRDTARPEIYNRDVELPKYMSAYATTAVSKACSCLALPTPATTTTSTTTTSTTTSTVLSTVRPSLHLQFLASVLPKIPA